MSIATICTCGKSLNGYCNSRVKECTQLIKNEPQQNNMSDNQYNPVYCEHKLPTGLTAWQFQSEMQSNADGPNKVTIHVCMLCGEISIGGYRPSKDGKHTNSFHETFNIDHPDAIDAIIKQANFYNEQAKWGRLHPSESAGVRLPFKVVLKTGEVHEVAKYIKDAEGEEHIWCREWYGHHKIGHDCEWYQESAGVKPLPYTKSFETEWKSVDHSYQIGDTGDYDGYTEITNGCVSIGLKDNYDNQQVRVIVAALNRWNIDMFEVRADGLAIDLHCCEYEKKMLEDRIKELENGASAVWVKCSDKLPPDGQEVSVWIAGAEMPIQAYVNTDDGKVVWRADPQWRDYTTSGEYPKDIRIDSCFEVTHWKPLSHGPDESPSLSPAQSGKEEPEKAFWRKLFYKLNELGYTDFTEDDFETLQDLVCPDFTLNGKGKEDAAELLNWIKESDLIRTEHGAWEKWDNGKALYRPFALDNDELHDIFKQKNK